MSALALKAGFHLLARLGVAVASILESIFGDQEAADNSREEGGGDEGEPFLDEAADRLAVNAEKLGFEKEPGAPGDEGEHHEPEKTIAGKARGDGHDRVGYRRHALDEDDPMSPFGVSRAEGLDALAVAVDRD